MGEGISLYHFISSRFFQNKTHVNINISTYLEKVYFTLPFAGQILILILITSISSNRWEEFSKFITGQMLITILMKVKAEFKTL